MAFIPGISDIADALNRIRDAILSFVNSVASFFSNFVDFLTWLMTVISTTFGRAMEELKKVFDMIGEQMAGFFVWLGTKIIDTMWGAVQPMIAAMWRAIEVGERIVLCALSQTLVGLYNKLVKLIYFNFLMVGVEISMRTIPRIVERSATKGIAGMIRGIFWGLASVFFTPILTLIPASIIVSYIPQPRADACLEPLSTAGLGAIDYKAPVLPVSPPTIIGAGTEVVGRELFDGSIFRHTDKASIPTRIELRDETRYSFVE